MDEVMGMEILENLEEKWNTGLHKTRQDVSGLWGRLSIIIMTSKSCRAAGLRKVSVGSVQVLSRDVTEAREHAVTAVHPIHAVSYPYFYTYYSRFVDVFPTATLWERLTGRASIDVASYTRTKE
jgi:hypothetical protein